MTLYHFTCNHGARLIFLDRDTLRPMSLGLLWLTDLARPDRNGLGLTMHMLSCDRTANRFIVDKPRHTELWTDVRMRFSDEWRRELEQTEGAMPEHWYVTSRPQRARRG